MLTCVRQSDIERRWYDRSLLEMVIPVKKQYFFLQCSWLFYLCIFCEHNVLNTKQITFIIENLWHSTYIAFFFYEGFVWVALFEYFRWIANSGKYPTLFINILVIPQIMFYRVILGHWHIQLCYCQVFKQILEL